MVVEDPNFAGFDSVFIGSKNGKPLPKNDMDLFGLAEYIRDHKKEYKDLTNEELEMFRLK